jgi:Putative peptidoglycan binding domain
MALWAARHPASDSSAEARPKPLMQTASRVTQALSKLDADLRAGGFGGNCRGLAREFYFSFTATAVTVRGTKDEAMTWAIGRALAIDLDRAGARRSALALLDGLIEFGASHADPQILERLRETEEAINQKMGRHRRTVARAAKVSKDPPAAAPLPVQCGPSRQPGPDHSPVEPPAVEEDVDERLGRQLQAEPSASRGDTLPQSLLNAAGQTSEAGHPMLSGPAESSWSPLTQLDEASDAVRSAEVADPEPVPPGSEIESPAPILLTPMAETHSGTEPDPRVRCGERNEEQPSDGEEGHCGPEGRQESRLLHAAPEPSTERRLRIGLDELAVRPLPDLPAGRPRSRLGDEFVVGAASALVGVVLYLLISHGANFLSNSLSMLRSIAPSWSDAPLANVLTANAPSGSASISATAVQAVAGADMDVTEKVPSPDRGRLLLLSPEQVRYCVFQGRRLGYLRKQIGGDDSNQRFNTLVADFNPRCSNFRFENNELQAASQQAEARRDQLEADANRILASWAPTVFMPLINLQTRQGAGGVQGRLKALGYYNYTVDGVWSPTSVAALSRFRQQQGLGSDGVWDLATQKALLGK